MRTGLSAICLAVWTGVASAAPADAPLTVRVGAYENRPKISTTSKGSVVGFFPALLDHIAKAENWRIEYVPGTWQEGLDRLRAGEIDIMPDMALSAEREILFTFTEETALISWAVIYTRPEIKVQSFFDLSARRIALMKGSIYSEGEDSIRRMLAQFDIHADFLEYGSYREVFQALANGMADAGVVNNIFGTFAEKDYPVARSPVLFSPSQLRFAFNRNSALGQRLKSRLDQRLRDLKNDPASFYYRAMDTHLYGTPRTTELGAAADWKTVLSEKEKAWLKAHPVIHLAYDPEFYPFEFRGEKGDYQGIASEYVRLFNHRLGLNMQVTDTLDWSTAVAEIKNGVLDVLPCIGVTEERSRYLLFTKPYIHYQRVILTRIDTPFLTGLEDIASMRVGVQADTSHEGFIRETTMIEPVLFSSLQDSLLGLSGGKVDAVIANLSSAAYWIHRLNLLNLKVAAPASSETFTLQFGVRKDWPELVDILNKALDLVPPEQQQEIHHRWVGVEYKTGIEPRVAWRIGLRVAAFLVIVLAAILIWTYRLKREIARRLEVEERLHFRERFERLVAETSSRFIALRPDDIDRHIEATLAELVCFMHMTRGYVYLFDSERHPLLTHSSDPSLRSGEESTTGFWDNTISARLLRNEVVIDHSDKGTRVAIPCVFEDRVTGFVGLIDPGAARGNWSEEDISLLRLMGQILSGALRRKDVEEAVERYAVDLEKANRQLQDLDRLKSLFIASVSHELRTPLNSIIGFTGVLLKGMTGELNERQLDQLTRVHGSAQHLLALITDIIDISKIEAGHIDVYPQAFPLAEAIQESIDFILPQLQSKSLHLETEIPPGIELYTDRKRLRQCLLNYLSNAIKYSEKGRIRIEARDLGTDFEVRVSDTGIGIAAEDLPRLFDPFVRLDSHLRIKAGGTGLGLYLTRKIAREILRGDLSVTSEKGRGSVFALRAPKRLSETPPERSPT